MREFEIKDKFYLNKEEFRVISGAIHYFRVVPEYWRDRLEKLKASGCNTVETYVPWNMHERKKGCFNFSGMLNIKEFIKTAQDVGLWVIVRPSPYICAEFEFGGLPYWLLKDRNIRLREYDKVYLKHVKEYYDELFKILIPLQINNGGPIIMMQVENEYGSYGNDKRYLRALRDMMLDYGTVVPLVTSDGAWAPMQESGKIEGVFPTANFGSNPKTQFEGLKPYVNDGPLMCMEFWLGWFDAWGGKHHTRDAEDVGAQVKELLDMGGNLNIYMFHGGTNFGFTNGSNYGEKLTPDVASYDYDGPITEWGDLTPKYYAIKAAIAEHIEIPKVTFTTKIKKVSYGEISVEEKVSLFSCLDELSTCIQSTSPKSMEDLDQNFGYILYRSNIGRERHIDLSISQGRDRAQIFINENLKCTQFDKEIGEAIRLNLEKKDDNIVDILVENLGRVNYGKKLNEQRKGIIDGVIIDSYYHFGWNQYSLSLDNIENLSFKGEYKENTPSFYKFTLDVKDKGDTFINMDGWGKGCIFLNGFNLGRFWNIGPQKSLYIPAPLLKYGENEIIIFETEGINNNSIKFEDIPNLG